MTLPILLAEAAPPNHGDWLTNLHFFLTLVIAISIVWGFATNRPQRREISFQTEVATKAEFKRLEAAQAAFAHTRDLERFQTDHQGLREQIHTLRDEWRQDKDEIIRSGEDRATKIHERINNLSTTLTAAVGEMRGELRRIHDH